jgi:hypothetical protein
MGVLVAEGMGVFDGIGVLVGAVGVGIVGVGEALAVSTVPGDPGVLPKPKGKLHAVVNRTSKIKDICIFFISLSFFNETTGKQQPPFSIRSIRNSRAPVNGREGLSLRK